MSMGIEPVERSRGVAPAARVEQSSAMDDSTKEKLEKIMQMVEQLFKLLAQILGKDAGEAGDSPDCDGAAPEAGGGKGAPAGGSGKGAPSAEGGGGKGAPSAEGGKGGRSDKSRPDGKPEQTPGGGGDVNKGPVGAGQAEVDIDRDGKADVSVKGDGAADYAKQVEKLVAKAPEVGQQMLDGAKANPSGTFEITIRDLGRDEKGNEIAGLAPVGSQKGAVEHGKVEIDDKWRDHNIDHVLVHEIAHNRAYTHNNGADSKEMEQEVERIVGPE
jgi:hypothetical protein